MTKIVDGPLLTGEVVSAQTGAPLAGVTVTVSSTVYTDQELSAGATTSLVTNGQGVFSAYAPPGTYTFTVPAYAVTPEPIEIRSRDEGAGNTSLIKRLSGTFLAQSPGDAGQNVSGPLRITPQSQGHLALSLFGLAGAWVQGTDDASPDLAFRDYYLGRVEVAPGNAASTNTDNFYIQHNASHTTLTGPVVAGATSLPLAAALTLFGANTDDTGNKYVWIADASDITKVESVQVTAGSGTTTLTVTTLQHDHPSGAVVWGAFDRAHQATFELGRSGGNYAINAKWRMTIRGDVSTNGRQPTLGNLRLVIPSNGASTADYFAVESEDESTKSYRIMSDGGIRAESSATGSVEAHGSGTFNTNVLHLSDVTPADWMLGAFVAGTNLPQPYPYITAIDVAAKTVTVTGQVLNGDVTGTGAWSIVKPRWSIVAPSTAGSPYQPLVSYWAAVGAVSRGALVRGKFAIGATATIPQADMDVSAASSTAGVNLRLWTPTGSGYAQLDIITSNTGGGQVDFQQGGVSRIKFATGANVGLGSGAAISTSATTGFVHLPQMAGTPTGTPTALDTRTPVIVDTTGSKLWAYIGGAWKSVTFA